MRSFRSCRSVGVRLPARCPVASSASSAQIYALIAGLARDGKAILLVDQNIKGALGIADHVYVMRTGTLFAEGPRDDFSDDVETLVSRWLYTT